MSGSLYQFQLNDWYQNKIGPVWVPLVSELIELLRKGDEITRMMQVTGEEGVSTDDFILQQKALFLDMVYLQQDAFDDVDVSAPLRRQQETFDLVYRIARTDFAFDDKEAVRKFFTEQTSLFKNLNYAADGSPDRKELLEKIKANVSAAPTHVTG